MKDILYDKPGFFKEYRAIRDNPHSYNQLLEMPAFLSMLPDISGASMLDIGCGAGEACREFIKMGAAWAG